MKNNVHNKHSKNCPKSPTGFTLIELMIVVAIIGVLAAVGVPVYRQNVLKGKFSHVVTAIALKEKQFLIDFANGESNFIDGNGNFNCDDTYTNEFNSTHRDLVIPGTANERYTVAQFSDCQIRGRIQNPDNPIDLDGINLVVIPIYDSTNKSMKWSIRTISSCKDPWNIC